MKTSVQKSQLFLLFQRKKFNVFGSNEVFFFYIPIYTHTNEMGGYVRLLFYGLKPFYFYTVTQSDSPPAWLSITRNT